MSEPTAADSTAPVTTISIGAVVKRSFSVFFANFLSFGVLALVFQLPGLVYNLMTFEQSLNEIEPSFGVGEIIVLILSIVLSYVLMGALVYGTVSYLRGRPAGLGEIVSRGLAAFFPVLVIAIAASLLMAIGFALLIVPGILVVVVFAVTVPAYVVEKPGIVGSFKRSMALTKGNRWRVLGILLVLIVIFTLLGLVAGTLAGVAAFLGSGLSLVLIVNYVVSALLSAVLAVSVAVLYHDLRIAKEGVSTEEIAAVFD